MADIDLTALKFTAVGPPPKESNALSNMALNTLIRSFYTKIEKEDPNFELYHQEFVEQFGPLVKIKGKDTAKNAARWINEYKPINHEEEEAALQKIKKLLANSTQS